jgi:hypothetical protein
MDCVYLLRTIRFTLFMQSVTVYTKNHMCHINVLCGQNAEFFDVELDDTYSNYRALRA